MKVNTYTIVIICFSSKRYSQNNRNSFFQHVETKIFVSAMIIRDEGTKAIRYSVRVITEGYILALSHNALGQWRKVIAYKSYCSEHR